MSKILAISSSPDPHIDMVQDCLVDKIDMFDPYKIPTGEEYFTFEWGGTNFVVNTSSGLIEQPHSVWYRKPVLNTMEDIGLDPEYVKYAYENYRTSVLNIYNSFYKSFWVSDYWTIMRCNSKTYPTKVVSELGFEVPKFIITSEDAQARSFIQEHDRVITKPLGSSVIVRGDDAYAFYTTRISKEELELVEGLAFAPAIFQEEIEKELDIRVTVVGTDIFTCSIRQLGQMQNEIDWRVDIADGTYLEYQQHRLPIDLNDRCIGLVKQLGLKYGAIDLVLDKNGIYWFLEINPNGQWAFVELETGLPIANSIAKLLEDH